jgi:hypothetical protein
VTDPSEGRDGTTVAALAIHVATLRREVAALTAKVTTLTSKQIQHTAQLSDIADLRRQVEQILSTLTAGDADDAPGWFWLTMTDEERDDKLSELTDWVDTVLRVQYPDYVGETLKPCWPNHPEARWELAWLYHLWTSAYLAERPSPRDVADWHDRWLPGVITRLRQLTSRCGPACQ